MRTRDEINRLWGGYIATQSGNLDIFEIGRMASGNDILRYEFARLEAKTVYDYTLSFGGYLKICMDNDWDPFPFNFDALKLLIEPVGSKNYAAKHVSSIQRIFEIIGSKVEMTRLQKLEIRYILDLKQDAKKQTPFTRENYLTIMGHRARNNKEMMAKLAIALMFHTSMRVGEVSSLRISDITLKPGKTEDSWYYEFEIKKHKTVKKTNKTRYPVLYQIGNNPSLCPARMLQKYMNFREANTDHADDRLFHVSKHISMVRATNMREAIHELFLEYKIEGIVTHGLRAGFITTAMEDGVPLNIVMDQSGHQTVSVALSYARSATKQRAQILQNTSEKNYEGLKATTVSYLSSPKDKAQSERAKQKERRKRQYLAIIEKAKKAREE